MSRHIRDRAIYTSDISDSDDETIIEEELVTPDSSLNNESDTDSESLNDNSYPTPTEITEIDYIYYYGLIEHEIHDFTRMDYPEDDDLNDGYYIGFCSYENDNSLLLRNFVSSKVFFKYPIHKILNYLLNWSCVPRYTLLNCEIEIMKLKKKPTTSSSMYLYEVDKKTCLLKYIQIAWKNALKHKEDIIKKRFNIDNLNYRQIHGKWPQGLNNTPRLKGCLYYYSSDPVREILYKY